MFDSEQALSKSEDKSDNHATWVTSSGVYRTNILYKST